MPTACEAAKETLLRGARAFVEEAGHRPMMTSKSCDGTPITVSHRSARKQPGAAGKAVRSAGRSCEEFLVQHQFLRARLGADCWTTKVILAEPAPLHYGKSVPAILSASRKHWWTLRALGHRGCVVEHYCWDRFGIISLDRETRKWHAAQPLPPLPLHISPEVARLTEFVVITPCALHDSQNAFKWSMHDQFTDKDLLRDVYIAIESLRRSADLIDTHIYAWIMETMSVRGDRWGGVGRSSPHHVA